MFKFSTVDNQYTVFINTARDFTTCQLVQSYKINELHQILRDTETAIYTFPLTYQQYQSEGNNKVYYLKHFRTKITFYTVPRQAHGVAR